MSRPGYVLVVEDDPNTADVLAMILQDAGIWVRITNSCAKAKEIAQYEKPALCLFDYLLEDETCAALIDKDGTAFGAPVILMTAAQRGVEIASSLNVSALIEKPFGIDDLTDLVKSYMLPTSATG